jgi:hypothetical protein
MKASKGAKGSEGLKVGDMVWQFDTTHRVYKKNAKGETYGAPIEREYWRPRTIASETPKLWILSNGDKVLKRDLSYANWPSGRAHVLTRVEEVEDLCWVKDHAYRISRAVLSCQDPKRLRAVAATVGYEDTLPGDEEC